MTAMPDVHPTAARPAAPPIPSVQRACQILVGDGHRHLGVQGPFTATPVAVEQRPDSAIHVIRLAAPTAERRFFLKTLRSTPGARQETVTALMTEYRVLTDLRARFAPFPRLDVVKPVACLPDDLSLLTEEFPGRTLETFLRHRPLFRPSAQSQDAVRLCRLTGEWLRRFQEFTAAGDGAAFDVFELFAYCDERLRIILDSRDGGLDRRIAAATIKHLERLAAGIPRADLALVGRQNDFRPENILTDGTRVVVVDFTGFRPGPRLYDFMKFWMKLEDLGSWPAGRRRVTARLQQAFREGYGPAVNLSSPLAAFLRVAYMLDKISEAVDPDLPPARLGRRFVMSRWYRTQRQRLHQIVYGSD